MLPFINKLTSSQPHPFMASKNTTLGQLVAYATVILGSQYCMHAFMVFVFSHYARLILWDHTGVLVMEQINLKEQECLFNFFVNYNCMTPEAQGYDSTVVLPNNDEIKCAITIVPEFKKEDTFLAVKLSSNWYITHAPRPQPDIPVGHWTHSSFAYDI
jgi:hypothetical protein